MTRPAPLRCPGCSKWLGVRLADGRVEIVHRGRRWVGPTPDAIYCEGAGCDGVWTPGARVSAEAEGWRRWIARCQAVARLGLP